MKIRQLSRWTEEMIWSRALLKMTRWLLIHTPLDGGHVGWVSRMLGKPKCGIERKLMRLGWIHLGLFRMQALFICYRQCLGSPQVHRLNPNTHCHSFGGGAFGRGPAPEGRAPLNVITAHENRCHILHLLLPCEDTEKDDRVRARSCVLTKYVICWLLDLGLPSLQDCEK